MRFRTPRNAIFAVVFGRSFRILKTLGVPFRDKHQSPVGMETSSIEIHEVRAGPQQIDCGADQRVCLGQPRPLQSTALEFPKYFARLHAENKSVPSEVRDQKSNIREEDGTS
jgi:hypothetical protein